MFKHTFTVNRPLMLCQIL